MQNCFGVKKHPKGKKKKEREKKEILSEYLFSLKKFFISILKKFIAFEFEHNDKVRTLVTMKSVHQSC